MSCIYLGKKEYWDHIDNAARDVAAPVKRAGEVGGGRLKALYALQAGMNARDIQKNQKTDKAINKNNAVGINISLGSTGWKDHAETVTEETKGSRITAGKTAAVIAKEDMTVKGSTVNAKDIFLKAGNNIYILSSENRSTTIEDYKAKKREHRSFPQQRRLWHRRVLRERKRTDRRNHPYPYPVRHHSKRYGIPFERKRHPDPGRDS